MSANAVQAHPDSDSTVCPDSATVPSRERVHHTYCDFSLFIKEGGQLPKQKKAGSNFPSKLQRMLSDERFSDIITWMPHGRAWKILNKKLLLSTAIPAYFGQTKFESFTRQLSHWGFRRLHRSGPDFDCYYHQCFLRGLPQLTALMRRVPRKKLIPHPESEPDFYLISNMRPLPPLAPLVPSGQDSRSRAPVLVQPGTMVASSASTSNPAQEDRRGGDTEQNRMLSTQPQFKFFCSDSDSTGVELSAFVSNPK